MPRIIPVVSPEVFTFRLAALESWLWGEGYSTLRLGRQPRLEQLAAQVTALSDLYTVDRERRAGAASDLAHRVAKVLYFLCSDAPKVALILRELAGRYPPTTPPGGGGGGGGRPLRLVDLGAGVGATAAGLLLSLDAQETPDVHLEGADTDPEVLRLWQAVAWQAARIAGVRLQLQTSVCDLAAPADRSAVEPADLVVAQTVLNELTFTAHPPTDTQGDSVTLAVNAADATRAAWVGQWARQGLTIIIEPALHDPTRALQRVRDRLMAEGSIRVLAPCPHQQPCPMLANKRDWCHELRLQAPTPKVAQIQALTRRRDDRAKYSFLVLTPSESGLGKRESTGDRPADALVQAQPPAHLAGRLVSDALNSKGKMERWLCTSTGQLVQLRLLDRQRTPANELLATAERGTIVDISGAVSLPRITEEAVVRDASPASP